jgi:hypothetical protein
MYHISRKEYIYQIRTEEIRDLDLNSVEIQCNSAGQSYFEAR